MRGKNRLDRVSRDINERMNMMRVMTGDDDDDDDDKEVGSAGADTYTQTLNGMQTHKT